MENRIKSEPAYSTFIADYLKEYSTAMFKYIGAPNQDAVLLSEVLSRAELRGIDSRGVARMHTWFDTLQILERSLNDIFV